MCILEKIWLYICIFYFSEVYILSKKLKNDYII